MSSNEYMRVYMLNRYRERRSDALARFGNKCTKCGSSEDLEFDHIDPSTKSFTIGKLWSVSEARFEEELKKCQLLCQTCHSEKTVQESGKTLARGTHGTLSSYRYCKCDECRKAHTAYVREWKRKNK